MIASLRRAVSGQRARWMWSVASVVVAVALTVRVAVKAWGGRADPSSTWPYAELGMTDFKDTAVLPNRAIAAGVNPYDLHSYTAMFPRVQEFDAYAPGWLTATRPLSWLDWPWATAVYVAAVVLLTSLLVGCQVVEGVRRLRPCSSSVSQLGVAGLALCVAWTSRPTAIALGLGNISVLLVMAASSALLTESTALAAGALAVAWVKPQIGLPVAAFLVVMGRWRPAAAGTALAAVASAPEVILLSQTHGFAGLVRSVVDGALEVAGREQDWAMNGRIDLGGVAHAVGQRPPLWASLLLTSAGLVVCVLAVRRCASRGRLVEAAALSAIAVDVLVPHYFYDMTLVFFPLALLVCSRWGRLADAVRRRRPTTAVAAAALVIAGVSGLCWMPPTLFTEPDGLVLVLRQLFWLVCAAAVVLVAWPSQAPDEVDLRRGRP